MVMVMISLVSLMREMTSKEELMLPPEEKQKKMPKLLKKQLLPLKLRLILRLNKREKLLKLLLPNNKPKLKL